MTTKRTRRKIQMRLNDEELDKLREEMHLLEEKLNEMTHGEFYGSCAARGLETYKIKEMERLVSKFPQIRDTLREYIAKHVEFYEKYYGQYGKTLTDIKADESVQNILSLQRHFPRFSLANYARK